MLFTDPPYNVPIDGHVNGLGKVKHREFELASGEMDEDAFTQFLTESLQAAAAPMKDGAIAFVCMDWRHMRELINAGYAVFDELKNLCVWNKTNGGMGTFSRSKHELVFVFKKGRAPHTNNFGLGDTGRYRTNVWDYAGINTFGETRDADLAMHPTVKPVALIGDAIKDCSKRGEIVLDTFGGSGSTLIAADQCGRRARLIELDPLYCDTIIRRFERIGGETATLEQTGETFAQAGQSRSQSTHQNQLPDSTISNKGASK
jgi:DNA modification methylase